MRKSTKIWLIAGSLLVLIGCIAFGAVMTALDWDFTKLSTAKYETNDYEIEEAYTNISIITDTADITFVPTENGKTSVSCHEPENNRHSVSVKDGTLVIESVDTREWYEYIGINFQTPKVRVYLPKDKYGTLSVKSSTGAVKLPGELGFESIDIKESTGKVICGASASELLKIKTSTGDIEVKGVSAGRIDLSVTTGRITASDVECKGDIRLNTSTGKVSLTDVRCNALISDGDTGSISLKNVIAAEAFNIERDTGDVKLTACDAAEIFIETDTGDVSGSLLTDKVFITETDTGDVDVPKTVTGGRCEISTDTGDIKIRITGT